MVPGEILVPATRLALTSKVVDIRERIHDEEAVEERRLKAEERWSIYQKRISRAYNKSVKARPFKIDDLVLKTADIYKNAQMLINFFLSGKDHTSFEKLTLVGIFSSLDLTQTDI